MLLPTAPPWYGAGGSPRRTSRRIPLGRCQPSALLHQEMYIYSMSNLGSHLTPARLLESAKPSPARSSAQFLLCPALLPLFPQVFLQALPQAQPTPSARPLPPWLLASTPPSSPSRGRRTPAPPTPARPSASCSLCPGCSNRPAPPVVRAATPLLMSGRADIRGYRRHYFQ